MASGRDEDGGHLGGRPPIEIDDVHSSDTTGVLGPGPVSTSLSGARRAAAALAPAPCPLGSTAGRPIASGRRRIADRRRDDDIDGRRRL